jgi:hypothetical protein
LSRRAAQTGQLYLDDLYVFPGQDSTVFIMDGGFRVFELEVSA